jgi:chemotaxis signal transduction protein
VALVLQQARGTVALQVDDVEEVLEVDPASVRAVPPGLDRGARLSYLLRTPSGLVSVLDVGVLRAAADAILLGGAHA